jgi:hypothetical protein
MKEKGKECLKTLHRNHVASCIIVRCCRLSIKSFVHLDYFVRIMNDITTSSQDLVCFIYGVDERRSGSFFDGESNDGSSSLATAFCDADLGDKGHVLVSKILNLC